MELHHLDVKRTWVEGRVVMMVVEVLGYSSYLRASGGSLVPERLTELREKALLKKCLNDGGTSLLFLQTDRHRQTQRDRYQREA